MTALPRLRPTSPFPFSPLTWEQVSGEESVRQAVLANAIVDGALWLDTPSGELIRQAYVDLRASSDIRCGYERSAVTG